MARFIRMAVSSWASGGVPFTTLLRQRWVAPRACQRRASRTQSAGPPVPRSRARPSFLYVMYGLILWAIPMGLIAAVRPEMAKGIAEGMTAYLRGIPEELYALFGTGYLGYTAARTWGKVKGAER